MGAPCPRAAWGAAGMAHAGTPLADVLASCRTARARAESLLPGSGAEPSPVPVADSAAATAAWEEQASPADAAAAFQDAAAPFERRPLLQRSPLGDVSNRSPQRGAEAPTKAAAEEAGDATADGVAEASPTLLPLSLSPV